MTGDGASSWRWTHTERVALIVHHPDASYFNAK